MSYKEVKFCPECGSDLNINGECEYCKMIKERPTNPNMPKGIYRDEPPKLGLLDNNRMPEQPIDMFCPECGSPLIENKTKCPKCNYKKNNKNSE